MAARKPGERRRNAPRTGARAAAARPARGTSARLPPDLERLVGAEVERRLGSLRKELRAEIEEVRARTTSNRATLVVFSGDLDRMIAALVIATGAAAMGLEVSMYFTFWGLAALRRRRRLKGKRPLEQAFAALSDAGLGSLPMSRMNFAGAGRTLLARRMKQADVASAEELFTLARESGVRMIACRMSMDVLALAEDELLPGTEVAGAATYLADAADSRITLFI